MLFRLLFLLFIVFSLNAIAQNKDVNVSYINEKIKLDAVLNEASWYIKKPCNRFLVYNDNYLTDSKFAPRFRSINLKITY